jgi:hypothetical protein
MGGICSGCSTRGLSVQAEHSTHEISSETFNSGRFDAVSPALTHVSDNTHMKRMFVGKVPWGRGLYALAVAASLA